MKKNRNRNIRLEFYVNENELELIEKRKEKTKMDRSKYLRAIALNGEIKHVDFTYLDELIMEINRIGININQIAKRVNESNTIYKSEIKELKLLIEEINEKIYEKM